MSPSLRFVVLLTVLMMASAAFGQPTIVNFDFGAVRIACGNGYAYEWPVLSCNYPPTQNFNASSGFGWMLGSVIPRSGNPLNLGAGLTGPNSGFCPPSFDGLPFNQAVILQSIGSFVWQAVGGFTAGSYTLSFYLGGRCAFGPQTVEAMIDGNVIGTWTVPVGMPFTLETARFTVSTDGVHALEFMGINPPDSTAFLSYVVITSD
jgi:hypothetical protein